jgi:hypothetical protein
VLAGDFLSSRISKAQSVKSKTKNGTNRLSYVYIKRLVAFFLVSLFCPVLLVVALVAALILEAKLNPFRYQESDVLET